MAILALQIVCQHDLGAEAADLFNERFDDLLAAELARAGVRTLVQPGGSRMDPEVIKACDELGVAMVFTGMRCFRH